MKSVLAACIALLAVAVPPAVAQDFPAPKMLRSMV